MKMVAVTVELIKNVVVCTSQFGGLHILISAWAGPILQDVDYVITP